MESTNSCPADEACLPCQGGIPPLANEEIKTLLEELESGWRLNQGSHLYKEYTFSNFVESMSFANKIAEVAEREGHHPDLKIAWGKCAVEIWSHKIEGLTGSDFILTAKIEELYGKG